MIPPPMKSFSWGVKSNDALCFNAVYVSGAVPQECGINTVNNCRTHTMYFATEYSTQTSSILFSNSSLK